ncbi:MAG: hypothetical protein Q9165_004449 [Trypethelium subeluteriae]
MLSKFTTLVLTTLVATAACSPFPAAVLETNTLVPRQDNCTEYCSVDAGCTCTVRPSDCSAFYEVQSGDTCLTIGQKFNNFTISQLYRWNPSMTLNCYLQAYVPICINTPWYTYTPPIQPPYGTHYTVSQDPVPIMPGIIDTCQEYEIVGPGTRTDQLAAENGFNVTDFPKWNGNATTAWQDYWACVKA